MHPPPNVQLFSGQDTQQEPLVDQRIGITHVNPFWVLYDIPANMPDRSWDFWAPVRPIGNDLPPSPGLPGLPDDEENEEEPAGVANGDTAVQADAEELFPGVSVDANAEHEGDENNGKSEAEDRDDGAGSDDKADGGVKHKDEDQSEDEDADTVDIQWLESDEEPELEAESPDVPVHPGQPRGGVALSAVAKGKRKADDNDNGDDADNRDQQSSDERPIKKRRVVQHRRPAGSSQARGTHASVSDHTSPGDKSTIKRGQPWIEIEEKACQDIMRDIMTNRTHIKGENRFEETGQRLQAMGYNRNGGAVKNYWNRVGRAATGLDERRKKNNPLATSKQDKATKEARRRRRQALQTQQAQDNEEDEDEGESDESEYNDDDDDDDNSDDGDDQ